jgi:penicillin-binding protein 1B
MSKNTVQKTKKSKRKSNKSSVNRSVLVRISLVSVKVMIALLFTLAIYLIYLDAKVTNTFEGQRWHVPVQVYGKIEQLKLGQQVNLDNIAESLLINNYQKVNYVTKVGQFSRSIAGLNVFQRPFDYDSSSNRAQQISIKVNDKVVIF